MKTTMQKYANLRRAPLALALLLGIGGEVLAQEVSADTTYLTYSGSAFDLDNEALVYTEVHYLALAGERVRERLVLYRCPNGAAFARKRVQDSPLPAVPQFELEDRRLNYSEGLKIDTDKVEVYVREPDETEVKREVLAKVPADLVADAGFDVLVRENWDSLVAGETVRFQFLVPSRLDYLGFKVSMIDQAQIDGKAARTFRLALGGVLGLVVSGIDVSYDATSRTILRFSGLSNVRDPEGENYVVRIDFPPAKRQPVPGKEAMEAARAEELVRSCSSPVDHTGAT